MSSIEIIEETICVEKSLAGVFVRLGPVLVGDGPVFEMREKTVLDRVKGLFFLKGHQVYNDDIDKRFRSNDYPSPLYSLDASLGAKIAALPQGAKIASNGQVITLHLRAETTQGSINDAIGIARDIGKKLERKFAYFEGFPGAKRQARANWSECPDPQLVIHEGGARIEVSVPWSSPMVLSAPNVNSLPSGILSLKNKAFYPRDKDDEALFEEYRKVSALELGAELGNTASIYSDMSDKNIKLNLYTDLTEGMARAAIELMVQLTAPRGGPFR